MDPISQQAFVAAGAGGSDPLYVDDVFSTFLHNGTGSAQTITNGIDLSGEGGLRGQKCEQHNSPSLSRHRTWRFKVFKIKSE